MVGVLECFYTCLSTSGLLLPMVLISVLAVFLFVAFYYDRGFKPLMGAQFSMTLGISSSLASMECYMSTWVWIYLGLITVGAVGITLMRHIVKRQVLRESMGTHKALSDLEEEFAISISILDTQRVRALAYEGRVYLSVGLVEMLDDQQLRAVIAHEVYHVVQSPPKLLTFLLALTSMTFMRYSDERFADDYAALIAGEDAISSALRKLGIKDTEQRVNSH